MQNITVEQKWYFDTLSMLATSIGHKWFALMKLNKDEPEDISWFLVPCDGGPFDEMEDLSVAADHPDRVTVVLKDGILFANPTRTPRSVWMSCKLKDQPELAGRII